MLPTYSYQSVPITTKHKYGHGAILEAQGTLLKGEVKSERDTLSIHIEFFFKFATYKLSKHTKGLFLTSNNAM